MCFTNQRFQAPSIKATLDPVAGAKDINAIVANKPRSGTDPLKMAPKKIPDPVITPPPQQAKAPNTAPLRRRNAGGVAVAAGSTLLSGPSGINAGALNLGSQTLLGGGGG